MSYTKSSNTLFSWKAVFAVSVMIASSLSALLPPNRASAAEWGPAQMTADFAATSNYGINQSATQHPISGEMLMSFYDPDDSGLVIAVLKTDGTLGDTLFIPSSDLKPANEQSDISNSQFLLTPGPNGEWLLMWATYVPMNVYGLGVSVSSTGTITRDVAPTTIAVDTYNSLTVGLNWAMLSASYGANEGKYLVAYTYRESQSGAVRPQLHAKTMSRNAGDTGFDVTQPVRLKTSDFGFEDVSDRSWLSATDTDDGWLVSFGAGNSNSTVNALSTTVSLSNGNLVMGTPVKVSSATTGTTLHPSIVPTTQGILIVFRHDTGVNGSDRYQVRGRWVTGTNTSSPDIIFASYSDSISRVRGAFSGGSISLVWNIVHDYASGDERVVVQDVPLNGSADEPVQIMPGDLIQQRPDITWSSEVGRFLITWVQKSEAGKWSVWLQDYGSAAVPNVPDIPSTPGELPSAGGTSIVTPAPNASNTAKVLRGQLVIRGFASRSAKLTANFKASLREFIRQHPDATSFRCAGFTASDQVLQHHPRLSRARARAVCNFVAKLAPRASLSTLGKTPIGRLGSQNRKVILKAFSITDK